MEKTFPSWLTKQMIRGVRGFNLDAYVMALEGWRRGLTLTWYYDLAEFTNLKIIGFNPIGKSFSLQSTQKKHYFYRSRGDKVANEAVNIVQDKHLTKSYFKKHGVSSPEGVLIKKGITENVIVQSIGHLCYPLVVKPVLGSLGKGVVTNIQSEKELLNSVAYVRKNFDYNYLLIEEHYTGEEYRVYVVADKVVAATKRVPANIVGDRKSCISELIERKNRARKENPYLLKKLIKVDDNLRTFLRNQDLTLESIPAKNKQVFLKGQSNISAGGDPIDVTDSLSNEIKTKAIHAIEAIPNLVHAGVDVISNGKRTAVIEVNATAEVPMHIFPLEGKARNVPEKIMDYYFPETIGLASINAKIYYNHRQILRLLRGKYINNIEIANAPVGKLYAKRYVISGKVQGVGFRRWIRRQAIDRRLHGYARNLKNGNVVVVVGGANKSKVEEFKEVCLIGSKRAEVKSVKEFLWNKQIKVGFEIRKTR